MKKYTHIISILSLLVSIIFCPIVSYCDEIPPEAQNVLDWLKSNAKTIQNAMSHGDVFYEYTATLRSIYSKPFGKSEIFQFYPSNTIVTRSCMYSKNHKKLYFEALDTQNGQAHLFAIPIQGKPEYIFTFNRDFRYYDVAPDGKEIVLSMEDEGRNWLAHYSLATKQVTLFTDLPEGALYPDFSPDGDSIIYSSRRRLMLRNIKTGMDKIMVDDNNVKELPKWSPDGKWITYQASTGGANATYDVYRMEVSSGTVTKLTNNPNLDANPSFDKTGRKIVFVTTPEGITPGNRLCVMDADGNNKKIDPTSPPNCWRPDF